MGRKRRNDEGLPERVYAHHGAYYYRPRGGKSTRLCRERCDVERSLAQHLQAGLVAGDTREHLVIRPKGAIADAVRRYRVEELPKLADETQRLYERYLTSIEAAFGRALPGQVKPSMIYQFCDKVSSSKGVHHIIAALFRTLYRYMIEWGWTDVNPAREVRKPNGKQRTVVPDADELEAFKRAAGPFLALYVDFKVAYGFRQKDLLELPPIPLTAQTFKREISKSRRWDDAAGARVGRTEEYEVTEETREILRALYALPRPQSFTRLFCKRNGKPYTSKGFRTTWDRAMARYLKANAGAQRFHEHDIRATTGTSDKENAQQRLTHLRKTTTDGYLRGFEHEVIKPLEKARIIRKKR